MGLAVLQPGEPQANLPSWSPQKDKARPLRTLFGSHTVCFFYLTSNADAVFSFSCHLYFSAWLQLKFPSAMQLPAILGSSPISPKSRQKTFTGCGWHSLLNPKLPYGPGLGFLTEKLPRQGSLKTMGKSKRGHQPSPPFPFPSSLVRHEVQKTPPTQTKWTQLLCPRASRLAYGTDH